MGIALAVFFKKFFMEEIKDSILQELRSAFPDLKIVEEYAFHVTRRWRFDYAVPEIRLAIELNGGNWSGGRHVRGFGYINDLKKINSAQLMGWTVLQYTYDYNSIISLISDLEQFKDSLN